MKKEAFKLLESLNGTWWHYGRILAVRRALQADLEKNNTNTVLDVGAGYGGMFDLLSKYGSVDAFEPNEEAVLSCERKEYSKVFRSLDEILGGQTYDLVGAFDVIEHIEDDRDFVSKLFSITNIGGKIAVTVPAFQWLWSEHDVEHRHFRRYRRKEIEKLLKEAGYTVEYVGYWNILLFLPAAIVRLLGKSGGSSLHFHSFIDSMLKAVLWLESRCIPMIRFPFGTGIVAIAKRNK